MFGRILNTPLHQGSKFKNNLSLYSSYAKRLPWKFHFFVRMEWYIKMIEANCLKMQILMWQYRQRTNCSRQVYTSHYRDSNSQFFYKRAVWNISNPFLIKLRTFNLKPATLLIRDSGTVLLLWILGNFSEQLFGRTGDSSCDLKALLLN